MKHTSGRFYVLRAVDCFGDSWPLGNAFAGIDGVRHDSGEAAELVARRFGSDKAFRTELRGVNGWQQNSIRKLEIAEVVVS